MIKLVLSDLDGTLMPFGRTRVSARACEAIGLLRSAGIQFGLATGRDRFELMHFFDDDSAYQTGILSNGKKLMVDGELIRCTLIDRDAVVRLTSLVARYPGCFVTVFPYDSDPSNPVYCIGADKTDLRPWEERFSFTAIPVDTVPEVDIIGSTIACPLAQDVLDEIKTLGAELCPTLDFLQPAPHWCDLLPRGLNKGTALLELLDALDIGADEVAVFGDAENDLSLFAPAKHSVAVSNATPTLRDAARWHIGDSSDEAAAEAFEQIARAGGREERIEFMRV